jgi:hypothetical protein
MIKLSSKIYLGLGFIGATVLLGVLHMELFHDPKTLLFYLALDIVFVPIQVLLVTVIIEALMADRERQALMKKLNMVIGAFFSEAGSELLRKITAFCDDAPELRERMNITPEWKAKEFKSAMQDAGKRDYRFSPKRDQLKGLRDFLLSQRMFILGLLQNPNLLEHDSFSDLLWAVTHLTEELESRKDLNDIPDSDVEHLKNDIKRAFGVLIREWLSYMQHLKDNYPYMYSLGVRNSPLKLESSTVIR